MDSTALILPGITAQGMINGDCSGNNDGITTRDALAVQKAVVGLITLPEE